MLNAGWFFDPDYEWGIGSSPIIYKNLVIVQCDIQRNSFLAAFDADTGKEVWRTAARRDSFVVDADDLRGERQGGARHAGDHVHPRLRSDDRQGAVEVLGQLRDRDPDADRRPRRRRHHQRLPRRAADFRDQARGARATSRCKNKATKSDFVAWSTTRGGPYIPTPVIYGDQLYVLQNNGVLAAYKVAHRRTGLPEAPGRRAARSARHPSRRTARSTARAKTATSSWSKPVPSTRSSRRIRSARSSWPRPPSPTGSSSSAG